MQCCAKGKAVCAGMFSLHVSACIVHQNTDALTSLKSHGGLPDGSKWLKDTVVGC